MRQRSLTPSPSVIGGAALTIPSPGTRGILFLHPAPNPTFVPFGPGRMLLGRDPAAGVPLDGKAVSWQHAEITNRDGDSYIRDLDSTNGVIVKGQRVREARLDDGTLIRIGDFFGMIATAPGPRASAVFPEAESLGLVIGPALATALAPLAETLRDQGGLFTIEGETGTGKSLIARLVHARLRPGGPFVAVESGRVQDGAAMDRILADAARGVVYLSNLPNLAPLAQTRLADALRAPDAERLCLVGGSQEPLATARDNGEVLPALLEALAAATPAVRRLSLPPLRERVVEIPGLFRHLLQQYGRRPHAGRASANAPSLSTELVERLCIYDWPCNVREMVLIVQRLVSLHSDEPRLRATHLPPRLMPPDREGTTLPVAPVGDVDPSALLNAVRAAGGNISSAALRLGITRERAYRLIDRLGLVRGSA
jgi:transcriptional regulator of acetoin/glycerol metabolism